MACKSVTLSGLNAICKEGKGGVVKVWLAPFDATDAKDIVVSDENTVTIPADGFKCYAFRRNSASLTSTLEVNENAGNTYTTELTMDFLKQDATKRLEISAVLASASRAIVRDANGIYHLLGSTYPVEASAATVETGTAVADANHYSITLSDTDDHLPYILDEDSAAAIEAILPPA